MHELLKLYFDNKRLDEKLILYTTVKGLENTGELTLVKFFYETKYCKILLYSDFFKEGVDVLLNQLLQCAENKLQLHDSVQDGLLGFYKNQYRQKKNRKNLTYASGEDNYSYWVGDRFLLFDFAGKGNPDSWLYNDKDGNVVFELTPVYPWFYSNPVPGEIFIKYSEWMKQYQPLLKTMITKEAAQKWLVKLQELITIVQKISKRLPCGGMLDCGGCIHLGKKND